MFAAYARRPFQENAELLVRMTHTVRFYRVAEPYGFCSNFAPYAIEVDGKTRPTSEHYFQAQKFLSPDDQEAIRSESSPMIAARMGRDRKRPLRADWEQVMRRAVLAKFSQHERLREELLATGEAMIVEHTERDSYWGDGGDGTGKNMLGRILMEVRQRLRQE